MIETLLDTQGIGFAAFIGAVAIIGLLVERFLLGRGFRPYDLLGFPLGEELQPLSAPPEGRGQTASVDYRVLEREGRAIFWAQPGARRAPMGLHGCVVFLRSTRGVHMHVRWAPPWTLLVALLWFAGLGIARGQGFLSVPIALVLAMVIGLSYRNAALRAARELRWAFVQRGPEE
ncbi:MAG: hypothetical protein EA397_19150 [Deltaproteobacteria bacterium]|nr:MAG: hypothetical protein EA397_19150 [Deltaproteobacteria bacterium]